MMTYISEHSVVIDRPIEEVFDFVTVPMNWKMVRKWNTKAHGGGGEGDTDVVHRTPQPGETFVEEMHLRDGTWVAEWSIPRVERPTIWSYATLRFEGVDLDADIGSVYSFEALGGTKTRWTRTRTTRMAPGAKFPDNMISLGPDDSLEGGLLTLCQEYLEAQS
jgi:Polyketide cyclase / dehydrase and lipid transport